MSINVRPNEPHLKWIRGVIRVFLTLTLLYALLCVGGCALQRRLIYFPTRLDPDSAETAAGREGFVGRTELQDVGHQARAVMEGVLPFLALRHKARVWEGRDQVVAHQYVNAALETLGIRN